MRVYVCDGLKHNRMASAPFLFMVARLRFDFVGCSDTSRGDGDAFEDKQHQQQKMQFAQIEIERIQEKQAAIQQIEKDVVQLNEMFHDLSYLVQEQQVGIDNIENNITVTKEETKTAHTELVEVHSSPPTDDCAAHYTLSLPIHSLFPFIVCLCAAKQSGPRVPKINS